MKEIRVTMGGCRLNGRVRKQDDEDTLRGGMPTQPALLNRAQELLENHAKRQGGCEE